MIRGTYMKKLFQSFRSIMHGQTIVLPEQKFTALIFCVSLVHLCYLFFFFILGIPLLYIYNLCAVLFYLFCTYYTYKEHYNFTFTGCVVEINIHALLTSLCIGYDGGFTMFCIIIAPIAFYMAFSLSAFRRRIFTPCFAAFFSFLVFLLAHFLSNYLPHPYEEFINARQTTLLYSFNATVTFFILVFFSLLFILEIQNVQFNLEKQNRYLDNLARMDFLTRLLNRRSMQEYLDQALHDAVQNSCPFCLVLGDIDDFKQINDTYGHECGDQVLVHISGMIRSQVGEPNQVCRWGGEEILILLHCPLEQSIELIEHIRRQIACVPTLYQEHRISHTMTFGLAACQPELSLEDIIRTADHNLYRGKRQGKNVVIY